MSNQRTLAIVLFIVVGHPEHQAADHDGDLDAEAVDVRVRLEYAFAPDWAGLVELPWRNLSGGTLDGFIENWHDVFNLPNGSRTELPADQLLLDYHTAAATLLHVEESVSGIADIPISAAFWA